MRLGAASLVAVLAVLARGSSGKRVKPNILFIMADDMGWGDVGWSDTPQLPTPNLRRLKDEGVELTQFYSQPKCTAARAALMTARYPFRMGLQTNRVFNRVSDNYLDLSLKLLPGYMKDAGYTTHMVGKWHLGNCRPEAIPTHRGFDSYFGSWGNTEDYYHHAPAPGFYEWTFNDTTWLAANGTYNTNLITDRTQFLLREHFTHNATKTEPLFLYVPYLAPHKPAMVDDKYKNFPECANLTDTPDYTRRTYCGMVAALDEGVGNITNTMEELGVLDDFIVIFTSDNGAAINVGASPWPLRGNKQTVYEGGTRVRTVVRAPKFLPNVTGEYDGLMHITDVLPTLMHAAGRWRHIPEGLDGVSAWAALKRGRGLTRRRWMVYNIDNDRQLGALRFKNRTHDYKLVYYNATTLTGWRAPDPRPEAEQDADLERKRRYRINGAQYRLFNIKTNPEEREPSERFPDAAVSNRKMLWKLKKKLAILTEQVMPAPQYSLLNKDSPGHFRNNNGAVGVGGCEDLSPTDTR